MKAIQLFLIDFDPYENIVSDAISERLLGTFVPDGKYTAIGKANEFLKTYQFTWPFQIMHDGEVYPQIVYKEITIT